MKIVVLICCIVIFCCACNTTSPTSQQQPRNSIVTDEPIKGMAIAKNEPVTPSKEEASEPTANQPKSKPMLTDEEYERMEEERALAELNQIRKEIQEELYVAQKLKTKLQTVKDKTEELKKAQHSENYTPKEVKDLVDELDKEVSGKPLLLGIEYQRIATARKKSKSEQKLTLTQLRQKLAQARLDLKKQKERRQQLHSALENAKNEGSELIHKIKKQLDTHH